MAKKRVKKGPLGTGLAQNARNKIKGRGAQINKAVSKATRKKKK